MDHLLGQKSGHCRGVAISEGVFDLGSINSPIWIRLAAVMKHLYHFVPS